MATKTFLLAAFLLCAIGHVQSRPWPTLQKWLGLGRRASENAGGDLWALLIAGSAGWGNYRHQADVAHAYQVLKRGGVSDDRIIVMVFDDLADNPENPRPGQLFNQPSGPDVYAGLPKDYSGSAVNAANFLAVLAGNESAVEVGRHASGRVIRAGPSDRIFVFYSDHGAPGIVGMPSGDFLYADQLHDVIKRRRLGGGFKEMVLYIEACESGSMFDGLLEQNLDVYATTAANGQESSWGVYCPGMDPAPPAEFTTCLGDLYSVAWMENADANDLRVETLKKQYQLVRARTSQNYTYAQGSHVMRFGNFGMDEEPVARWEGPLNDGSQGGANGVGQAPWTPLGAVPQRDADLVPLVVKAQRGAGTPAGRDAQRQLDAEVARRQAVDASVHSTVAALARQSDALSGLLSPPNSGPQEVADVVVNAPLPRAEGAALVDDWDCLRGMVAAWGAACGPLDQYGMRHTRAFANLCNSGVQPQALAAAAAGACTLRQRAAAAA